MADHSGHVLIVDSDQDVANIAQLVLTAAGFTASVLVRADQHAVRTAVGRLEPECVLLDGTNRNDYGLAWDTAAWLGTRERHVPAVMFTTSQAAQREAREATSPRSHAARFDAVLSKPFDLDELVDTVARAVGHAVPFDPTPRAEVQRTARLRAKLEAASAQDVHTSTRREWADFRAPDGVLVQIYWWERDRVYYVMRHAETGGRIDQVGRFYDLDAAIALGMLVPPAQ